MFVCAGASLLAGCAASRPVKGDGYFAVTAAQAQLYRFGPSQPTGADAVLWKGQRLVMLRQEYGFSRVMTEDGVTGFVANDLIAPTSPPPKRVPPGGLAWSDVPPLPPRGTGTPGVSSANRAILQNDPLFGGDKLPPLPDASARPGFRFNVRAPSAPPADN